jgi:hypothetical protein
MMKRLLIAPALACAALSAGEFDEMGSVTLQVVPARQSDFGTLIAALQEKRTESIKNAYKNRMAGVFGAGERK